MSNTPITVAHGDGIGPEIMAATLHILKEAGARTRHRDNRDRREGLPARQHRRHRAQRLGIPAPHQGLPQGAHHHAARRRLQEPQRHHPQDARPLRQRPPLRRPTIPFVDTKHPGMDVVIVRENEEDLYAGIEHQQTDEVIQCLKLISAARLRKDRPLRLRVRASQQPQEGHLLHQRQHHEA